VVIIFKKQLQLHFMFLDSELHLSMLVSSCLYNYILLSNILVKISQLHDIGLYKNCATERYIGYSCVRFETTYYVFFLSQKDLCCYIDNSFLLTEFSLLIRPVIYESSS